MSFQASDLPRVLSGAEDLQALMAAAQAAQRPLSLLLGPVPESGGATFLPPAQRLAHLQPLACSRGLYLGLFEKELPPESLADLPRNIFFWRGTVHELRGILGEGFAAEAVSIGGVNAASLDRRLLLDLNAMLVPQGALSVYLFSWSGAKAVLQLQDRMVRAGLRDIRVEEVEDSRSTDLALEAERPIPYWPRPLATLVSATALRSTLPQPENGDPFVIGLNEVLDRKDPDYSAILACAVAWLHKGFPVPITTLRRDGGVEEILGFTRALLRGCAETDFRRDRIARGTAAAIQALCVLLDLSEEGGNRRRIPFLRALVREYPRHAQEPSETGLWSWLARITCAPRGRLKELHEKDLLAAIAEVLPSETVYGPLATLTDEVIAARRGDVFYPGDVWRRLAARIGTDEASLMNGPLRPVVVAGFWQHWDRLGPQSRQALTASLSADLEGLRAVGFEPPFEYLPSREQERMTCEALRAIFESKIPLIPFDRTIEELRRLLAARGIILLRPQLESMIPSLGSDLLWLGVAKGVIDERFLRFKRVSRPQPPAPQPPPPPQVSSPQPARRDPPPSPPSDGGGWAADLGRFLSRRGR